MSVFLPSFLAPVRVYSSFSHCPLYRCKLSYGFRPGRSAQDALKKIYHLVLPNTRLKWILDADIKSAFDQISHDYLLETIGPVPGKELIRQWLKAGYVEM